MATTDSVCIVTRDGMETFRCVSLYAKIDQHDNKWGMDSQSVSGEFVSGRCYQSRNSSAWTTNWSA